MFTFLHVNVNFGELLVTEFPLQLGFDTKSDVESKTTGRCRWYPCYRIVHLVALLIHSDYDQVLVDNGELFEGVRELRISDRPDYVVRFLLEVVSVTFLRERKR